MAPIPESHLDLLSGPYFAVFTTIAADGSPENTIVWCSSDGESVFVNTAEGRRKEQNVRQNPDVALCVLDPQDGGRWIDVRGVVDEITIDEDYKNINYHTRIYTGKDQFYGDVAPAEEEGTVERLIFRIRPDRVVTSPED